MLKYLGLGLFVWAFIEISLFAVGSLLWSRVPTYVFLPAYERLSDNQVRKYLETRDPVLGWLPKNLDDGKSRPTPAFPYPSPECASVYGDSFAWSSESSSDHTAWPNVLSKHLGCRVANYGLGGGGLDQALLRFQHQEDKSDVIIATLIPHNFLRHLTRNFGYLAGNDYRALKPRFRLDTDNQLVLDGLPFSNFSEARAYFDDPFNYFTDDDLTPYASEGATEFAFPYLFSAIHAFQTPRFWRAAQLLVTDTPPWTEFMNPGHPSKAFELTVSLVTRFNQLAQSRQKDFVLVFLPDSSSLKYYRKHSKWVYEDFMKTLTTKGIRVVNAGEHFLDYLNNEDICHLFRQGCHSHFTDEGYALLAALVYDTIQKKQGALNTRLERHANFEILGR